MLLQEARFTEAFKQLSGETLFFLMREGSQPGERDTTSFSDHFHWYAKNNISMDSLIRPLPNVAIFWLLKQDHINTLLLSLPRVVDKLNDMELLQAIELSNLYTHFEVCIQNPRLLARLTPEFCLKMFERDRRLTSRVLSTPVLMKEFKADFSYKLLRESTVSCFLAFAQYYPEGFRQFDLPGFSSFIRKFDFREDDSHYKKAGALTRYQLLYCLYPQQLEISRLPLQPPNLEWFDNPENQALLAQAYQAFEQQRVEEAKEKTLPTVGLVFEEPKVTLRIISGQEPAQKLPEPLVASWHSSVNEQTPLLPPPRARGPHTPQALLSVLGKTGLGLGGGLIPWPGGSAPWLRIKVFLESQQGLRPMHCSWGSVFWSRWAFGSSATQILLNPSPRYPGEEKESRTSPPRRP